MAFRGGGFPAQRQPSNSSTPSLAPLPLQSPSLGRAGQNQGSFPFGAAGVAMSPPPGNTQGSAPGGPETNLDISDFPALGSGISAAISTPSLLSSYASQAGTGLLPTTAAAGFLPNGAVLGNAPTGSVVPGNAREFSADDFPALGGFGGGEMGLGAANGQQSNGMSFLAGMGGGVGAGRTGAQEQASAVAALQHQQQQNQHRANLLGSMNGAAGQGQDGQQSRNVSGGPGFLAEGDKRALALKQANVVSPGGQQPWASSPNSQSFPPNSLPLSNGNGLAAPSPSTFPPGSQPTAEQQQQHQAQQQQQHQQQQLNQQQYQQQQLQQLQQQQLQQQQQQSQQGLNQQQMRSPPMQSAQGPPLSTSLPPGVAPPQPQRTVGSTGAPATATPASQVPSTNSLLPPTSQPTAKTPQTPAQQVLFSPADRFGLLGLLHIIKTSDPDISMLALGSDLTTLGLDLGATENLYSTFITPWSDSKAALALNIEPEFHLPSCYNVQPPPAGTKIGNFSDETLFFIFYSQPRDSMQDFAAHELYKHNWRYHKDLRLWLTKEAGTEPTQKTQSYERGSYIHFDPVLWERTRKDHVLVFDSLERRT